MTRETLIERYRDINVDDNYWSECPVEDLVEVCSKLGIDLKVGDVSWSVSYCQGDGASFSARGHSLLDVVVQCQAWTTAARNEYTNAEGDTTGVAKAADTFAQGVLEYFEAHLLSVELKAKMADTQLGIDTARSMYNHSGNMTLTIAVDGEGEDEREFDWLRDLYRGLADALHEALVEEYEYQTSDEQVWESITASGLDAEADDDESDTTETTEENDPCCA